MSSEGALKGRVLVDDEEDKGRVSLFGIVPSEQAKVATVTAAKKVAGVTAVEDELQIVPVSRREAVDVRDEIVQRDSATALDRAPELKHVDVAVKNGIVHLTGTVGSDWDRLHAAFVVRAIQGVRAVEDDLRVESPRG
jgi:osmotically-inducible protein OsmY